MIASWYAVSCLHFNWISREEIYRLRCSVNRANVSFSKFVMHRQYQRAEKRGLSDRFSNCQWRFRIYEAWILQLVHCNMIIRIPGSGWAIPDTRAGRYAYVQVALLVLFPGMHNARRGEFTLPMANRKSSANIRQETFFRPGRLSPFLEKCVDESHCTDSQGIAKTLYAAAATYSFSSENICGWRFSIARFDILYYKIRLTPIVAPTIFTLVLASMRTDLLPINIGQHRSPFACDRLF